jgi:hypothetical protein
MEIFLDAPWDRRPGESLPAFEAFCAYRNAGRHRSLREIAAQLGKSRSLIFRWSSKHHWVARAQAWDIDQAMVEHGDDPKAKQARLARLQRSLEGAMGALGHAPAEVTRRMEEDPDFLRDLDFRELQRLVQQAARLMPALVKAEQALVEEAQIRANDARLLEKERARREVESWSPEQRDAYLREAGFLDDHMTTDYESLDSDDV